MNGSVAKKTQDTLGKVIKKPPLTEKLLSKPPFRYLHDIFSEVIRTTGFMKGLYAETEMKSDNVKDKDAKIAFLQKALDVVMLVNGEPLSVKPARIVAGHEPERTNELLQAIAKCCLNKLSSEEAVKRVLAGDKLDPKGKASSSRSQDKENREGRDQVEKAIREHSAGGREQKDPDLPKEQEGRRGDKEKERHRDRERSKKSRDPDRTKDRGKDKSRDREWDKDNEREKDGERDKERDRDREKSKDKESHRGRDRERDKEKDLNPDKRRDKGEKERELRHKQGEEKTKVPEKGDKKARASEDTKHRPHPEEPSKTAKPEPASDSPARIPRPSSAKGQRRWPKAGGQQEFDGEDGDTPLAQRPVPLENGDATDAVPAHRRIPRPSSARPAPPRFKRQESYTDVTPAERLTSAKPPAAVITEGKKLSEDEDEQFVVLEAAPPPPDMPEMEPTVELQGDENHGGLVKKILETTKDFESSPSSPKSKDQTQSLVSEASRKKERDLVSREIERLRSSIQTVCRSALPLGKIMDYIQEDMDAMQNELHTWRRENKEHAQALLHEQRVTDSAVEPLKAELAELEQLIKEQQDKICAVKSNILKNEDKIHKMVTSINFSSRI
ncbi:TRAF3-interacting protein 1-like isoform X6 [Salvelinus fontinalis]|uniref:TRAF3-interacting protein 1-like isoform X6 n=1 Tax=Salvelinus fontinalis TaxID=8038 RepID=UPI002485E559|nr:TRAF3-interacting protein 1-like isoform X6 [Salvelinus fontinalis]